MLKLCAETSHIHEDECGAPEKFTGCKLLSVPTEDGKLTPDTIKKHAAAGNVRGIFNAAPHVSRRPGHGNILSLRGPVFRNRPRRQKRLGPDLSQLRRRIPNNGLNLLYDAQPKISKL